MVRVSAAWQERTRERVETHLATWHEAVATRVEQGACYDTVLIPADPAIPMRCAPGDISQLRALRDGLSRDP